MLLAACVFSLWELRHETDAEYIQLQAVSDAPVSPPAALRRASFVADARTETTLPQTKVAYNGSVIERYPLYREQCQKHIDNLVAESEHLGQVELVPALESSILGAAVALACAKEQKAVS